MSVTNRRDHKSASIFHRLVLSLNDVVRNADERRRPVTEGRQRLLGLVDQPLGLGLGPVQPQKLHVRGLVGHQILGGGLAQILRRGRDVQDVVGNLEGQADVEGVPLAGGDLLGGGAAEDGTGGDGHLEERRRLVGVDPSQLVQGGIALGLALEVHHLSTGQADVADGLAQPADDVEDAVGGNILGIASHVLEGGGEEGVAGEDGNVLSVNDLS